MCHGAQVQMKNLRLDTPQAVGTHALTIYQQVVATRAMPMGNARNITEDERCLVKQWFEGVPRWIERHLRKAQCSNTTASSLSACICFAAVSASVRALNGPTRTRVR